MRRSTKIFVTLLLTSIMFGSASAADEDVIDYRRHVMKAMGEEAYAIDLIYAHKIPADDLNKHLQALALTAATAKKAFEPKVVGGKAKLDVWTQWPDFSKRLDELVSVTADLAKTVKTPDNPKLQKEEVEESRCKLCHETYRVPSK